MAFRRAAIHSASRGPVLAAYSGGRYSVNFAAPSAVATSKLECRQVSSLIKKGAGGRSSFSGVVATVFGATGFVGRYVVNRLGRIGSQIIVPYRGDEYDYHHLQPMGDLGQILFRDYTLWDPESVRKVVQHSNVVINLIGRDYETRNFKFNDVHVAGARVIAEACRDSGVQQLIHFSALNASQDSPSTFLQSKAFGEQVVKDIFPEAVIVRPADVYGQEDRFLRYYAGFRVFPFGIVPVLHRGEGVSKIPIHVSDVASAVVQMVKEGSSETAYELIGPRAYTLQELIYYIYRVMYRHCRIVNCPPFLFKPAAFMLEQSPFVPFMTRDVMKRLHISNTPTPGVPGLEDLGVTPSLLENKAISVLRMYRNFLDMSRPVEEILPPMPLK